MKHFRNLIFTFLLLTVFFPFTSFCNDDIKLVPIGKVVYIYSFLKHPVVDTVLSDCAKTLKCEDVILSIDCEEKGKAKSLKDMQNIMKLEKTKISANILRNGKNKTLLMNSDELRLYQLSSFSAGLGTITAIDKDGNFIGLSHELSAVKNNIDFEKIKIYEADFIQQKKSSEDDVGFLVGNSVGNFLGEITKVNNFGVKGYCSNFKYNPNQALSIAKPKLGKAYILCTDPVTSELNLHEIEITKVEDELSTIKIIDDSLIKFRGGIVKGMSGSPIIQNNKIIGGVRSTKISNPKEGHITNIDSMLGITLK
ncbi:MAG: SpoIVB peptidase S55 domain-containing protein [Romboutsia sp.]|uniref:SpoIVB peptidase S55 domain-containing protein n=1 Tax=Romboutsia sp. TaxID=1965302 RepID=UPI003F2FBD87